MTTPRPTPARAGRDELAHVNSHGPLARLAVRPKDGQALWGTWHQHFTAEDQRYAELGLTTLSTTDDNQHGRFTLGPHWQRIGGQGIDAIGLTNTWGGAVVHVGKEQRCNLTIDGHDGWGVFLTVDWPSRKRTQFWLVQANLGRHDSDKLFLDNAAALWRTFGSGAVYAFDEIDEADGPNEHELIRTVFSKRRSFEPVGWSTMSPVFVGGMLDVVRPRVSFGSPGMAHVSPDRPIVSAIYRPAA